MLDGLQKAVLKQLRVAEGATYDSHAEEHNPTCLPTTRVELLHQISEWAHRPDAAAVFWLNGMAGTGKSTISRTVARTFAEIGSLGASFFFKRGEGDRGSLSKFFTTLTADLVVREPAIAPYVKNAIDTDPQITTKNAREQFDKLILQPLSAISTSARKSTPLVVVVDALDECDREDNVKLLIDLFSRAETLQCKRLKVFVTSRPELPIRPAFKAIKDKYQDLVYQDLVLHEMSEIVVGRDISAFLEHELARIRDEYNKSVSRDRHLASDWPGQSSIQSLVEMAVPLFIFAATVCRFLADHKFESPNEQLNEVLRFRTRSQESQLDATYLPVLNRLLDGEPAKKQNKILRQFRDIIGPIVILASPLSTSALAQLLDIPKHTIDSGLDMLHSVLSIPPAAEAPVRLLHLSFRDFLVDSEKRETNPFWINEQQAHEAMAANCLRILDSLKQDLCSIKAPGTPRSAISPQKVSTSLSPELQYACLHWVYHIRQAGNHVADNEPAHSFLTCHFLHWIEALSLMGRALESLGLITTLQALVKVRTTALVSRPHSC